MYLDTGSGSEGSRTRLGMAKAIDYTFGWPLGRKSRLGTSFVWTDYFWRMFGVNRARPSPIPYNSLSLGLSVASPVTLLTQPRSVSVSRLNCCLAMVAIQNVVFGCEI